jgi:hypothetical protein
MNDLEEVMADCYKKAINDLTNLLKETQEKTFEKLCRSNMLLTIICLTLSISVIIISILGYFNNKNWIDMFNSYEYEFISYEQDGNGNNAINAGEGDLTVGTETCN